MYCFVQFLLALNRRDQTKFIFIFLAIILASSLELASVVIITNDVNSLVVWEITLSVVAISFAATIQIVLTKVSMQKVTYLCLNFATSSLQTHRYKNENFIEKKLFSEELIGETQRACDYVLLPLTLSFARLPLLVCICLYLLYVFPLIVLPAIFATIICGGGLYAVSRLISLKANNLSERGARARALAIELSVQKMKTNQELTDSLKKLLLLGGFAYSEGRALTSAGSLTIRPIFEIGLIVSLGLAIYVSEPFRVGLTEFGFLIGFSALRILPNLQNIVTGILVAEANKSAVQKILNARQNNG
jgi:uncharacterized SAM-binding protein YcdF (DUF218 family)